MLGSLRAVGLSPNSGPRTVFHFCFLFSLPGFSREKVTARERGERSGREKEKYYNTAAQGSAGMFVPPKASLRCYKSAAAFMAFAKVVDFMARGRGPPLAL